MVVEGSRQETLDPGFVLLDTHQQRLPVFLRELVLPGGFDHHSSYQNQLKYDVCYWNSKRLSVNQHQDQNVQYNYQDSSTVRGGNLKNYESHHPEDTSVYQQLSVQNTSDPLARHYQQQPTMGEKKPDLSGERNQEEALEVDMTHIEESTEMSHQASPHMEFSRPKEKRKTKEHITT
ncbi:unnamed protein product [Schistosoma curassoni]|uniref:KIAA1257 n=1 Tax=Schistosoma curassoni TaxID=6186 RepID=A0A183JY95_9TREM|nr:unnamed protein product [Schistosoma curassoni]